jgi:hypothetical protein
MKTKKSVFSLKNASAWVVLMFIVLASCQKDASILDSTDTQNVNAESASSSYLSEGSDMSTSAIGGMSAIQYSGGRTDGLIISGLSDRDDRLKCAMVTMTFTGTKDNPSGKVTITFDPTCSDRRGIKRSGTIIINFSGKRWAVGSYFSIHANFYRNDVHVEGVDSVLTKLDASGTAGYLQFESILTNGKVTFGDGKTITREHDITREWFRATVSQNDEWHILKGGQATGKCKNGNTYQMLITEDLVHKISCLAEKVFIPVSGTKIVTVTTSTQTKEYDIDYGDGRCDNSITVSINGKAKTISVNGEGD